MKMKTIIILLLLTQLLASPAHSADKWDKEDKYLASTFTIATILDWGQTRDIVRHQKEYKQGDVLHREANPILGETPSLKRVDTYMPLYIGTTLLAAHVLPKKYKKYLLYYAAIIELAAITNNHGNGLIVNFHY